MPKEKFSSQNWYDVWFPTLAPGVDTVKLALESNTPAQWAIFVRKYKAEMSRPEANHALGLLAALSHTTNFSVGCYCVDESHCHRSVLRELLAARGAKIAS